MFSIIQRLRAKKITLRIQSLKIIIVMLLVSLNVSAQESSNTHIYLTGAESESPITEAIAVFGISSKITFSDQDDVIAMARQKCGRLDYTYLSVLFNVNGIRSFDELENYPSGTLTLPDCSKSEKKFHSGIQPTNFDEIVDTYDSKRFSQLLKSLYGEPNRYDELLSLNPATAGYFNEWLADTIQAAGFTNESNSLQQYFRLSPDTENPEFIKRFREISNIDIAAQALEYIELAISTNEAESWQNIVSSSNAILWPQQRDQDWSEKYITEGSKWAELDSAIQIYANVGKSTESLNAIGSVDSQILEPLTSNEADSGCGLATLNSYQNNWPFNLNSFLRIYSRYQQRLINHNVQVMLLDTGLDHTDEMGWQIPSGYVKELYIDGQSTRGYNAADRDKTSITNPSYKNRFHGMGVIGGLLGSSQMEAIRSLHEFPLSIYPVSLVSCDIGGDGVCREDNAAADIDSFFRSLLLARKHDFDIVNISYYSSQELPEFEDLLDETTGELLFVIAAGNDGKKFNALENGIWPAAYGGNPVNSPKNNFVSVGAHDSDGKLAKFSRHGAENIDLLAPGCHIPTYGQLENADGTISLHRRTLTGTSFSAPLVSFIASILRAQGVELPSIKSRLISSVDASFELADKVYSRGILNVEKAIAASHDILEVRVDGGTRIFYGTRRTPAHNRIKCGPSISVKLGQIRKMSFLWDNGDNYLHLVRNVKENSHYPVFVEELCPMNQMQGLKEISFHADFDSLGNQINEEKKYPIESVVDYIARSLSQD